MEDTTITVADAGAEATNPQAKVIKGEIKYVRLCEKDCKDDKGKPFTRRFFIGSIQTDADVIEFSCSFGVLEAPMRAKALRLLDRVYEEFGSKDVNHLLKWATVKFHYDEDDEYDNIIFDSVILDDEAVEVYTEELKNL